MTEPTADYVIEPQDVELWERDAFMAEAWEYNPGEHVTIIGPTGRGKTTLGLELLKHSATKEMKAFVLVSKPRDDTMLKYAEKRVLLDTIVKVPGFKVIENYPPGQELMRKYRGYLLKPYQSLTDFDGDDARMTREFRQCMRDCYASPKPRIVFADEVAELQNNLGLKKECIRYWQRGRSARAALWACAQRSAFNAQDMYNAAEHLFLFNDPDKRNRERFAQIGGVNPDLVEEITNTLDRFQVLYIRRTGPEMCIING